MTLASGTETSAAEQQQRTFNEASDMIIRASYSLDAGMAYALYGLILDDDTTAADEAAIIAGVTALDEFTLVANPRPYDQSPETILINPGGEDPDTHRVVLHVDTLLSYTKGWDEDTTSKKEKDSETQPVPLGKTWMVISCVIPAELSTAQMVADAEAALVGVTKVAVAEHLIDGVVPANASDATLGIVARMKIDPIPVEV